MVIRGWDSNVGCWDVCTLDCSPAVTSAVAQDALCPAALISSRRGRGTELRECLDNALRHMVQFLCGPAWSQESGSLIPVGPLQLVIFCDSLPTLTLSGSHLRALGDKTQFPFSSEFPENGWTHLPAWLCSQQAGPQE